MWWVWVVGGLVVWVVVAAVFGVLLGRSIREADRRAAATGDLGRLLPEEAPAPVLAPARARRRAVPLPPVGVGLAAAAVALMATGFLLRLNGATGTAAQVFSMDAPLSLPRLFVAGLFAVAALAAVAGAALNPGRRTWWLAVGLVAAAIASVKAGGTVHADAMAALVSAAGRPAAIAISAVAAVAVVGALFFLSRTERRDRRRVLGSLAGYAVASVGLGALTSVVPGSLAVTATFVEEAGEALGGVAFLMAALIGVAPRLVLPADWALRRSDDAHSLELAHPLDRAQPGVRPAGDPTP
ncbi:hypothetical protein [Blastococcus xanthinilyticus]|uniref:Uncharacterized protein n=1 Tax=Blastococcus xanthinilyticus TaxID=1564164 RepID=A0A5S5CTR3_9ACTN|nr:hypothetical protein [Blastococcus xanthinilyticus]TYP87177.1 hypothetical protein BD833_107117 [Blastococcus xanthinilyticus]